MFSYSAAFPADCSEPLNISSPNQCTWNSYDPRFTTPSGVYCYNYLDEYCYSPANCEQQYFADYHQPMYFYNPAYYGFYDQPVTTYLVPVFYYLVPVAYTASFFHTADVPSEYDDALDVSEVNDVGYATLEKRDASLSHCAEQETCSEVYTSFELYYDETEESVNDAPCKDDDDKDENDATNSTSCHSEAKSLSLQSVDLDKEHSLLELCAEFMTNPLPDNENNSDKESDKDSSDEDIGNDEDIDFDSSSSDSEDDNGTILKRHGNFMDLHHLYDYPQSSSPPRQKTFINRGIPAHSSSDFKFCRKPVKSWKNHGASSSCHKNFAVRGIDAHSSSDIKFCRKVPDNKDKLCTSATSPTSGVREVLTKDSSNDTYEVHAERGQTFMDMILSSEEYLGIQDNLENPKRYRDHVYKQSLKKNPRTIKKAVLLDVLPTLIEESSDFDDSTDELSAGDTNRIGHKPVIKKMKRRKRRFESFRKWFSKTFCCCCTTKDPP